MADYIEREALLHKAMYLDDRTFGTLMAVLANEIVDAPAADVVEVVHGEWLGTEVAYAWKCSACGGIMSLRANYCCYCGAKMDGGESDGK